MNRYRQKLRGPVTGLAGTFGRMGLRQDDNPREQDQSGLPRARGAAAGSPRTACPGVSAREEQINLSEWTPILPLLPSGGN